MAIDYRKLAQEAMAEGTPAETTDLYGSQLMPIDLPQGEQPMQPQAQPGQNLIQRQQPFMKQKERIQGQLAAARVPFKNPYDGLTPEQPAPQSVYSQDPSTTMSQWKGVK